MKWFLFLRIIAPFLLVVSTIAPVVRAQSVSSDSSTASVFGSMRSCYENLVSNRAGMKMLDKASEANDPAKTVLALPGKHHGVDGVFIVPYNGSEAAFQPLPAKSELPKYGIKEGEPIAAFHYRIQIKGKSIDLRYNQQVDTLAPNATRATTDAYAVTSDFETNNSPLSAPAIGQDKFGLAGSEIEQAFSDELIRRVNIGVAYYQYILPQPGSVFPDILKKNEKNENSAAIATCESTLNRNDFPAVFAAFDKAKAQYDHPTLPSGSTPDAGPFSNSNAHPI